MSGQGFGYPNQYPPQQQGQIYPQMYPNVMNQPNQGNPSAPPAGFSYQPYPGQGQPNPYPGQAQPNPYPYGQPGQQVMPPSAMSYAVNVTPTYGQQPYINPTPAYGPAVEWIRTTSDNAAVLNDRAVVAGYEAHDGSPLWVIRARFEGDLIPGKLAIAHKAAYVPWGGAENAVREIEVCCARPDRIRWVEGREGIIPTNAVMAGNTLDGETLYIGRAKESGSLTPGKVHPSHKVLYVSFAGREIPHKVYEILCSA